MRARIPRLAAVAFAADAKSDLAPKGSLLIRADFGTPGYGGPCPPQGDKPRRSRPAAAVNGER